MRKRFRFLAWLFKEKKFFKNCSGSRIIISVPASLSAIGQFTPVSTPHWMEENPLNCTVHLGVQYDIIGLQAGSCKRKETVSVDFGRNFVFH